MAVKISRDEISSLPDALTNEAFTLMWGNIPGESDNRRLTLQCKTAEVPEETNEVINIMLAGFQKRQSGTSTNTGTFPVTFMETSDMAISKRLRGWKQYARGLRTNSSVGYSENYSRTGELTIFDSTGKVASVVKIYKMWPSTINSISLDASNPASAVDVSCVFTFEYFENSEVSYF